MAKFRKKPVVIEATQWFRNGDHPEDDIQTITPAGGKPFPSEGKVVRYFRRPDVLGTNNCNHCSYTMHEHGWIDTLEGGHIVCPGDWVITGIEGERYPCKPGIFDETYERVKEGSLRIRCDHILTCKYESPEINGGVFSCSREADHTGIHIGESGDSSDFGVYFDGHWMIVKDFRTAITEAKMIIEKRLPEKPQVEYRKNEAA